MTGNLRVCISNRGRGKSTISDTFPGMWESIAMLTKTKFQPVWTSEYGNYDSYFNRWTYGSTMQKLVSGECNISEPLMPLSIRMEAVDCISYFYTWLDFAVVINKNMVSYEADFKETSFPENKRLSSDPSSKRRPCNIVPRIASLFSSPSDPPHCGHPRSRPPFAEEKVEYVVQGNWQRLRRVFSSQVNVLIAYNVTSAADKNSKWFNVLKLYEWICLIAAVFTFICVLGKRYKSATNITLLSSVAAGFWSVVYGNNILFSLFIKPHLPFTSLLEAVEQARDGKLKLAMALSDTTTTLFKNMETRRTTFFSKLKDILDKTKVQVEFTEEAVFRKIAKDYLTITGSFFGHSLRVAKKLFRHSNLIPVKAPQFTEVMTPLMHKNFTLRHNVNLAFMVLAEHGIGIRYSREVDHIQEALQWSDDVDQKPLRLDMMNTMFFAFGMASIVCCASEIYFSTSRLLCYHRLESHVRRGERRNMTVS